MNRWLLPAAAALFAAACAPAADEETAAGAQAKASPNAPSCGLSAGQEGQFVAIPEGAFEMGADAVYPEEGPSRVVHIAAFSMQAHEVTNQQFKRFADETGYVTDAERTSASGEEGGGSAIMRQQVRPGRIPGWELVRGATWRTPDGPGSDLAGRMALPVVHVSLNDARAYADWAGGRLPTEDEWEYAASLGMPDAADPLSGAFDPQGRPVANTWQGLFPVSNEAEDGFAEAAPAGCFPPGRTGLYDMIGNVWEWTETPYAGGQHTVKGGSFLCAPSYCRRYRGAARQGQDDDFSTNHIGFRIVKDAG